MHSVNKGHVSIINDADAYEGNSMRVYFPAGWGNRGRGAQWQSRFDKNYEEVYYSYKIKFSSGFDFVRGGKIPGIAGGTGNTGGNKPDGNNAG